MSKNFYLLGISLLSLVMLAMWVYYTPIDLQDLPNTTKIVTNQAINAENTLVDASTVKNWYAELMKPVLWVFDKNKPASDNSSKQAQGTFVNNQAKATLPPTKLVGITQVGAQRTALFSVNNKVERVHVGKHLTTDWVVKSIGLNQVILKNGNSEQKSFRLYKGE